MDTCELTAEVDFDATIELPWRDDAPGRTPSARSKAAADGAGPAPAGGEPRLEESGVLCERYVIEQQLAAGGTALISRARDLLHAGAGDGGHYVAIKQLRPELRDRPSYVARLEREFHQTRMLRHPNIVRMYDFNCDHGTWFIAMELLTGEVLGQRLRRLSPGGLPAQEALRVAEACADALAFAHEHGVTHGDVKPDNVFVTTADEVRVVDFGVAAVAVRWPVANGPGSELVLPPVATLAYASPQVLAGERPEPLDDVFSLACVIYEMLAGRHPYGRRGAIEARDSGLAIEPAPGITGPQWQVLQAGLAWRREQRPTGVHELLRGLRARNPLSRARPQVPASALVAAGNPRRRAYPVWRVAIACVSLAMLGLLIGAVGSRSSGGAQSPTQIAVPNLPGPAALSRTLPRLHGASLGMPDRKAGATAAPVTSDRTGTVRARTSPRPGRVSLDSPEMIVSRRAIAAAIPVRRLGDAGHRIGVAWRATDGTAVAGRDYGGPPAGTARLAEGQVVSIIYVPILTAADSAGDRTFTIALTGQASGADGAATRVVKVTILDDD